MTNEFKILWFEDETTWYTMQSKKVANHMLTTYNLKSLPLRETGAAFNPDILKTDNGYDLIIMDYKLAAGKTGAHMIELVRSNSILTDILLYSSQYKEMVDTLTKESPLIDGVYFADRKNPLFEEKLYGVIHKIVRRSEDIVNMRGSFLDSTSDFEVRIKELLKISWGKLEDNHQELNDYMNEILDQILCFDTQTVEEIRKDGNIFVNANNHKYALSIRSRLLVLSKIMDVLKESGKVDLYSQNRDLRGFSEKYNQEISAYRNALGHKKFSDTAIEVNGKVVQIDESLHRDLRKKVNKYDALISCIEKSLEYI